MKILGIDTSTAIGSIGLIDEGEIIAEQIKSSHMNRNPLIKGRPTKKFRRDIEKKVYFVFSMPCELYR